LCFDISNPFQLIETLLIFSVNFGKSVRSQMIGRTYEELTGAGGSRAHQCELSTEFGVDHWGGGAKGADMHICVGPNRRPTADPTAEFGAAGAIVLLQNKRHQLSC